MIKASASRGRGSEVSRDLIPRRFTYRLLAMPIPAFCPFENDRFSAVKQKGRCFHPSGIVDSTLDGLKAVPTTDCTTTGFIL